MKKHFNIRILGIVQGVSFRYYAKQEAERLGLTGLARNEQDSSVYIEAEGEEANLETFVDWCREGPKHAQVSDIKVKEGELKNYQGFSLG